VSQEAGQFGYLYDSAYYKPPNWSTIDATQDVNMNTFNITNAGSITSSSDFIGLGVTLPSSRVCNDDNKNLIVTRDNGNTIGKIYDSVYNPLPPIMSTSYININNVSTSSNGGLNVTSANNAQINLFNYGSFQSTKSVLNISACNFIFLTQPSNSGYMPSSFMVTITLGNTNASNNVIGESINFGFTIVSPTANTDVTYTLPTNTNQMVMNFSDTSSLMSLNMSIKGPTPPAGQNYIIYLRSYNIVGILDAYETQPLNPIITNTSLNQL
jgi:hypothetical protein